MFSLGLRALELRVELADQWKKNHSAGVSEGPGADASVQAGLAGPWGRQAAEELGPRLPGGDGWGCRA